MAHVGEGRDGDEGEEGQTEVAQTWSLQAGLAVLSDPTWGWKGTPPLSPRFSVGSLSLCSKSHEGKQPKVVF